MVHGKQRVISVAQHRKGLLHRLGREAMELYPVNPTTAYKYVMDKLEEEANQAILITDCELLKRLVVSRCHPEHQLHVGVRQILVGKRLRDQQKPQQAAWRSVKQAKQL